jgi:5'-nucleotidase
MRILLTNDDGIRAPGILAMHDALADVKSEFGGMLSDPRHTASRAPRSLVYTVAPQTVQSASGHGVTFHIPIITREERVHDRFTGVAVDARPADCVKIALTNLWPERFGKGELPDLVVSGMNAGANCGINVIYSGTVAAALEAAFWGVPSIAVSLLLGGGRPDFELAASFARRAIERLLREGLPRPHECLSVNIPRVEMGSSPRELPEIVVCPMNTHGLVDEYERRVAPSGEVYYWAAGDGLNFRGTNAGSDVEHLLRGRITVTPLSFDLTNHERVEHWRARSKP